LWPTILCGDDYHSWPQVGEAVRGALHSHEVDVHGFWWRRRSSLDKGPCAE
jgi:hypothetical protein